MRTMPVSFSYERRSTMATDIIMPALGMAQETGKIVQWLKAQGDHVTKGQPIAEVETDKAIVEIESPADGVLTGLVVAGDDVPVGQVIAKILALGETSRVEEKAAPQPALAQSNGSREIPSIVA